MATATEPRQTAAETFSMADKTQANLTQAEAFDWLKKMYLIRRFEERAEEAYGQGKIGGFLHLYIGEESIAVGSMAALQPDDDLITHYRDHGYSLARGVDPNACMAELYGKSTGLNHGKGGSMHFADPKKHIWGGYAIVGGQIPLATGFGFSNKYLNNKRVAVCFFGDGATNIGMFHEGLNMAAVWKLPVVFVVENNRYGMGTAVGRASAVTDIYKKGLAYNMPSVQIDGDDVQEVYMTMSSAVQAARRGDGPQFVEMLTYRFRGHSMGDPERYRKKEEVNAEKIKDPLPRFEHKLMELGLANEVDFRRLTSEVDATINAAVQFAESSPAPLESELYTDVLAEEYK